MALKTIWAIKTIEAIKAIEAIMALNAIKATKAIVNTGTAKVKVVKAIMDMREAIKAMVRTLKAMV